MATPSGTKLYQIYDQVRTDIFGTNDAWTASSASGIPTTAMDIYAQKVVSRINLHTFHNYITLNFTTGVVSPARDEAFALIEAGMLMLIKDTESSLLRRLSTGLGMTVASAEGVMVRDADGVVIDTKARFQERIRAFLQGGNAAREDFNNMLNQVKYDFRSNHGKRYIY